MMITIAHPRLTLETWLSQLTWSPYPQFPNLNGRNDHESPVYMAKHDTGLSGGNDRCTPQCYAFAGKPYYPNSIAASGAEPRFT